MIISSEPGSTPQISFLTLLKKPVLDADGKPIGRIVDGVLHLRSDQYPVLVAVLVNVGNHVAYVPITCLDSIEKAKIMMLAPFQEVGPYESNVEHVQIKKDVLEHRLLDVRRHALVKAYDIRLVKGTQGWIAAGVDLQKSSWFSFGISLKHSVRDWKQLVLLTTPHDATKAQAALNRIQRLKPAQLADLIEEASSYEQQQILAQVHSDPDLEAHVFEEIGDDGQMRLFKSLADQEVADVLARMRADDAADAVMDLPQSRRTVVLALLPEMKSRKIFALLGYNDATAGGLMGADYIALPEEQTINDALAEIRHATTQQPEALTTIFSIRPDGTLGGTVGLVRALQMDPSATLRVVVDSDVIYASPDDDIIAVTTRMADFNLLNLPVLDTQGRLLGVVTVDDALEMAIPRDWLQRRPPDLVRFNDR